MATVYAADLRGYVAEKIFFVKIDNMIHDFLELKYL